MLRVMLVDDEYLIRDLIRMRLDWKSYGMEITAEAGGGAEALDIAERLCPDIIFTDINMPDMSGLEFSRRVSEKYPQIKIVIITGHDDFEYARAGIRLGIADYLLKPIRTEELNAVAEKLARTIAAERQYEREYQRMRERLESGAARENDTKTDTLANQAKAYIHAHMAEEDLRLTTVADHLFVSAGHLGRLLKQDTGRPFVEYLTDLRIKKAVELLRSTGLKGYEIGARVGIHDPHYFSILFKKATGMSVKAFRAEILAEMVSDKA